MPSDRVVRPVPPIRPSLALTLLLAACGGGGGGGSGSGGGGADPVAGTLNDLGVDTDPSPRQGGPGIDAGPGYTPFGRNWELATTREVFLLGIQAGDRPGDAMSIFDVTDANGAASTTKLTAVPRLDATWAESGQLNGGFPASRRAPAAGDFDGDGLEEIAVVHQVGVETRIYTIEDAAQQHATSSQQIASRNGVTHFVAAAGDVDADGVDELIVGSTLNGRGELSVWERGANGFQQIGAARSFEPQATGGQLAMRLAVGDVDLDGRDEIAVVVNESFQSGNNVGALSRFALLDDATAGFAELSAGDTEGRLPDATPFRCVVADVAIGDIDGDAAGEVVFGGLTGFDTSGCAAAQYFAFWLEDASASYAKQPGHRFETFFRQCSSPGRPDVRFAFTGTLDIDGDGRDEIHVNEHVFDDFVDAAPWTRVDDYSPPDTVIYRGTRNGGFGETVGDIVVGDFTGDDREDLAVLRQDNDLQVWGVDQIRGTVALERTIDLEFTNVQTPIQPFVVPVNCDRDGPVLRFSDGDYQLVYTEPLPIAVMSAPPCIAGVQSGCVTAFGNTTSTSREVERSVSVRVGASVGVNIDGGFLTQSEFELQRTATRTARRVQSRAYTLAKTVIFTSGADEDTIVFTTIPVDQ